MLEDLKKEVLEANLLLPRYNLVTLTWGNVSAIDKERKYMVIKPSGLSYEEMKAEDMVVTDLEGNVVEGSLRPSSDTPTHVYLYKHFKDVWGICHTHSPWAASWAQAKKPIPCLGTTHADSFYGEIPCARDLTEAETEEAYEHYTGLIITEIFKDRDPMACPGVLCSSHGPFTWGKNAKAAADNALILETVAKMAAQTLQINPEAEGTKQYIADKHYNRKHGPKAYYGQA